MDVCYEYYGLIWCGESRTTRGYKCLKTIPFCLEAPRRWFHKIKIPISLWQWYLVKNRLISIVRVHLFYFISSRFTLAFSILLINSIQRELQKNLKCYAKTSNNFFYFFPLNSTSINGSKISCGVINLIKTYTDPTNLTTNLMRSNELYPHLH